MSKRKHKYSRQLHNAIKWTAESERSVRLLSRAMEKLEESHGEEGYSRTLRMQITDLDATEPTVIIRVDHDNTEDNPVERVSVFTVEGAIALRDFLNKHFPPEVE